MLLGSPPRNRLRSTAAGLFLALAAHAAQAADWTPVWQASPQPAWGPDNPLPMNVPALSNETIRQIARVSLGGRRLRIVLSNRYGAEPLVLGAAHVAPSAGGARIRATEDRTVTFSGHTSINIPPGAEVVSDPVDLAIPALAEISVSLYLPKATPPATFHWDGKQTGYIVHGEAVAATDLSATRTTTSRLFLTDILSETTGSAGAVVAFGDSITDGAASTVDSNHRWTDFLATRLAPRGLAVVNAGISGARVLKDRMGDNALARLDRDVLSQPNVRTLVLLMGINDIGWPGSAYEPTTPATSPRAVIEGYQQLITRARLRNIKVVGLTIGPFKGGLEGSPIWGYYSPQKDQARRVINNWIRTSGAFDAVVDLDAAFRDPADSTRLKANVDSGDHLHPGDQGYAALAQLVAPVVLDLQAHRHP